MFKDDKYEYKHILGHGFNVWGDGYFTLPQLDKYRR